MEKAILIEDTIEFLAGFNGLQNVSNLVIEECSELIKELTKLNRTLGSNEYVKEEICDVIIMIKQLMRCLDITDTDISQEMQIKLGRTLKRVGAMNDRN